MLLPIAACRNHERRLDSLRILAADDHGGKITEFEKHTLGTAVRKLATDPLGESRTDFHGHIFAHRRCRVLTFERPAHGAEWSASQALHSPGQPGSVSHSQPAPERSVARNRLQCVLLDWSGSQVADLQAEDNVVPRRSTTRRTTRRAADASGAKRPSGHVIIRARGRQAQLPANCSGRRPKPTRKVNRAEVAACGPRLWASARARLITARRLAMRSLLEGQVSGGGREVCLRW